MVPIVHVERGFADVPGARLAYDRAGQGSTVVLLHGAFLDRHMWDDQFSALACHFDTVRYDLRSAGQSETQLSPEPYAHHEDLRHLFQALAIPRASLVGLSNHAIALDFALAYPDLVHKLVLASPGLRGYAFQDPWVEERFGAMLHALEQRDLDGAVEIFLTMWLDGPYRTPAQVAPSIRERARAMVAHAFPVSRLAPNAMGLEPPALDRLGDVRVPTLVVLGEHDAPDIHRIGRLIHERLAGSQLVVVPGAGHTLTMEQPEVFNHLVEDFLRAA
jgi:pimeloyl-ACP methyl ester carboxylesterase